MTLCDGYPEGEAANLNIAGTHRPLVSRRRIEHLKQLAYDCNLTNEQARVFGKLTATATWEKLLLAHGLEFDRKPEISSPDGSTVSNEAPRQINLMDWLECQQLIALGLASVIFAVLFLSIFPNRPLHLLPQVRITVEFGAKK
ncbi:hypothetical protein QUA43_30825 [Microcoleus sp. N9_B4]|uniref:hypothetical protein n=1 Tax=Microcoleus sp. N9_B4 TaxID=3055386 RepID=UPI002FD64481